MCAAPASSSEHLVVFIHAITACCKVLSKKLLCFKMGAF